MHRPLPQLPSTLALHQVSLARGSPRNEKWAWLSLGPMRGRGEKSASEVMMTSFFRALGLPCYGKQYIIYLCFPCTEAANLACQYYLRNTKSYTLTNPLPDLGSRVAKYWFLVSARGQGSSQRSQRILTLQPVSKHCPIRLQRENVTLLNELLAALKVYTRNLYFVLNFVQMTFWHSTLFFILWSMSTTFPNTRRLSW